MDKKNLLTFGSIIVLVVLAAIIWTLPENGIGDIIPGGGFVPNQWSSPWDDVDSDSVTSSMQTWLGTESGRKTFNNSTADGAVPVFDEDKQLVMWIVPVMDYEGSYIGFIQVDGNDIDIPKSYTYYPESLAAFLSRDSAIDMHTFFILKYGSDYAPEQIMEPFVVMKSDGGFFWMSEIVVNGRVVETHFSSIRLVETKI